uniref:SET domain-containing protein n=1 Tax=Pseudo-nitzschia australis TaxID=44445 RepID=A0A7S4APL1_9STRA
MIDMAFDRLEEIEIDKKSMMQLRYALQEALEEQVKDLFDVFPSIDEELLLLVPDAGESMDGSTRTNTDIDIDIESYLEEILRLELERTIDEMVNTKQSRAPKGADPNAFLTLKRGAIETLLLEREGKQQSHRPRQPLQETSNNSSDSESTKNDDNSSASDAFGYHVSIDEERNRLIRYYQSINLCRSAKMRDTVGYSVVALRSSIPGAGRGVYVDGYARAGSILAFQPGPVWNKESLTNLSVEEERNLERNDAYQMSLRADDYMIDSRRSPYTVLTDDNSNLMALGHIVNHPSPTNPPSCRSAMLNFTQDMALGSSAKHKRYIPNTYARPRNITLMDSLRDRDVIEMHSLVLVATRDICNEEIFYDYRLASSHLPQWYHRVNDTAYEVMDDVDEDDGDEDGDDK